MGLVEYEEQYFYQLVAFGNAETVDAQRAAFLEMQRIALEHQVRVVDKDAPRNARSMCLPKRFAMSWLFLSRRDS